MKDKQLVRIKERILSILLLFILITQCLLSYVLFEMGRNHCYALFSGTLPNNQIENIETVIFPNKSNIYWEWENREFLLNGKLYDVVSIQRNDTSTIIKCISDTREEGILKNYFKSLGYPEKNDDQTNILLKFQDIKYLITEIPIIHFVNSFHNEMKNIVEDALPTVFLEIISPPPKYYAVYN